jgi:hypothetical protein
MNKDFLTIVGNCGARVQDTSSAFATIIKAFVNQRYFKVLRAINWQNINYAYTFDTVASTQDYVLPDDFSKEVSARDTTNGTELSPVDFEELVRYYPDAVADAGTVERYVILEDTVKAQPTSASTISVVSSSASDTTQTILIRGISSGVETSESVTLTGTTPAVSTNSYTRVKAISKSAVTVGKITLTSNSSAVSIAVMAPKVKESRYKLIKLHYVPSSVITVSLPYITKPLPLTEDNDYPVLDIADLIEIGAEADAWRYKRQNAKAQAMEVLFATELQNYIWDKENQPNKITQFSPTTFDKNQLF